VIRAFIDAEIRIEGAEGEPGTVTERLTSRIESAYSARLIKDVSKIWRIGSKVDMGIPIRCERCGYESAAIILCSTIGSILGVKS